jgi:FkbM family methyltransferase
MLEAMYLGKPVVATAYGGNTDFADRTNSLPIDFELVPIKKTFGRHYKEGMEWAQPDIEQAAEFMSRIRGDKDLYDRISRRAAQDVKKKYHPHKTLNELYGKIREIANPVEKRPVSRVQDKAFKSLEDIKLIKTILDKSLPREACRAEIKSLTPIAVRANELVPAPILVKNSSSFKWPALGLPDHRYRLFLLYRWLSADKGVEVQGGFRTPLPHDLEPGAEVLLSARIKAPATTGKYILEFDMVQENVTRFKDMGSSTLQVPIDISQRMTTKDKKLPEAAFHAKLRSYTLPVVKTNNCFTFPIFVKNLSPFQWPSSDEKRRRYPVSISYRWFDQEEKTCEVEEIRNSLDCDLEPNQEIITPVQVRTPGKAGDYFLELDVIQEGFVSFKEKGSETLRIPVKVITDHEASNFGISTKNIIYREIFGRKMLIDVNDHSLGFSLLSKGKWKEQEIHILERLLKKGDLFVDVGANVGYYSLMAAKMVGNEGRIYAFEPEHSYFSLLKYNLNINRYYHVIAEQKIITGCSDSNELRKSFPDVEKTTLDAFFEHQIGNFNVDVIKINTHGNEDRVLEGLQKTISRSPSLKILVDLYPSRIRELDKDPFEFVKKLSMNGLNVLFYDFVGKELKCIDDLDRIRGEIEKSHGLNHRQSCFNLLLTPPQNKAAILESAGV